MSVKKMYYNITELHNHSIGFYPKLDLNPEDKSKNMREIYITFSLFQYKNKYYWRQINGHVIYGITKKNGEQLLNSLNDDIKEFNMEATSIMNIANRQIFPITNNSTFYIINNYYT
jgi:hypothetical protein